MKENIRKTLRKGDTIVVRSKIPALGVVIDEELKEKHPESAHTFFMVRLENGKEIYCCAYNCEKVITDENGFMSVLR